MIPELNIDSADTAKNPAKNQPQAGIRASFIFPALLIPHKTNTATSKISVIYKKPEVHSLNGRVHSCKITRV